MIIPSSYGRRLALLDFNGEVLKYVADDPQIDPVLLKLIMVMICLFGEGPGMLEEGRKSSCPH